MDGSFVRYPSRLSAGALAYSYKFLVASISGHGTDSIDIDASSAAGIAFVNNSGAGRILVSAHTLAFMLELAKEKKISVQEIQAGSGFGQRAVSKKFHLQDRSIGVIGC